MTLEEAREERLNTIRLFFMGDYQVTEFLMKRTSVKQPFHKIIHALLPYITVMTALCFIENVVDRLFG